MESTRGIAIQPHHITKFLLLLHGIVNSINIRANHLLWLLTKSCDLRYVLDLFRCFEELSNILTIGILILVLNELLELAVLLDELATEAVVEETHEIERSCLYVGIIPFFVHPGLFEKRDKSIWVFHLEVL
jgi:hypothetical protein